MPSLFIAILLIFVTIFGCNPKQEDEAAWVKIKTNFTPPPKYVNQFGSLNSPLKFYDGKPVKTPEDWKKRRLEILDTWHQMMGKWPKFIKNQTPEIIEKSNRGNGIVQYKIRFLWMPNETTIGYLLIPENSGKKPAVVTVYYEPETAIGKGKPYRDYAIQLAKRGFVTLSIGTTKATKSKTYSLYYPDIDSAQVEPLSMLAYAAANSWFILANHPEVDATRIGIVGHSFGGKWAMFASCLFDRFACAVWSDPGIIFDETRKDINYWEPWYLGYYPKPWRERGVITPDNPAHGLYPKLVKEGFNLHELHALMAPRPFLVSGGSEDPPKRWEALNNTISVNKLLGFDNRVAMTNRQQHSPDSISNEQVYLFFEHFLKN